MDEKKSNLWYRVDRRAWQKVVSSYRSTISRFLHTQQQSLLTSGLLVVILVLLFGIFSQLQPPLTSTPPDGVTVIDYTTFVRQVKAGNVLAVIIQGNTIHGLLALPFSGNSTLVTRSSRNDAVDIAVWSRNVSEGYLSQGEAPARASPRSRAFSPPRIDSRRTIYTSIPASGDANLMPLLLNEHVIVSIRPVVRPAAWLWPFLDCILLLFLTLLLPSMLSPGATMRSFNFPSDGVSQMGKRRMRRAEHGKEPTGPRRTPSKSRAAPSASEDAHGNGDPAVTFADVAGIDEVRGELEEIAAFLRCPERFSRLGAHIPRGALLIGPPGTGKTLLAKAVAGEAGVPFFSMSASEFVEMFVGVGARRVRDLFNQARQSAPCVIFLDELDAVGRKRSMSVMGHDERDQTLNQLLVELDGFDSRQAIVVLAATNRVDILDPALLRPGRFDRHIAISLPDHAGREAILKVHTRHTPLHEDVSLERLARLTTGMSGADLANLVNEAALVAARRNLEHIPQQCFEEALARVQLGALRPLVMSEADKRVIAYHEAGHALVAYHLPQADTVNQVTILPRGQSLGVTQFTARQDCYNYSREALMARIAVGLGGRAAEALAFGPEHITTGAENDLQMVTELARRMVTRWGMSEQIGVVFAGYEPEGISFNMRRLDIEAMRMRAHALVADADGGLLLNGRNALARSSTSTMSMPAVCNRSTTMATMIDHEVQCILNEGYTRAHVLLSQHYDSLTKLAEALLEHEQLDRTQFEALLRA